MCVWKTTEGPFHTASEDNQQSERRERVWERERTFVGIRWVPAARHFLSLHYRSAQARPVRHMRLQLFLNKKLNKAARSICEKGCWCDGFSFLSSFFSFLFFSDVNMKAAVVAEATEMTMTERSQSFKTFMDSETCHLFAGAVTSPGYYCSESDRAAIRQRLVTLLYDLVWKKNPLTKERQQ